MRFTERLLFLLTVGVWFFFAKLYLDIPAKAFQGNDFSGHVGYTKIIVEESRLPAPFEAWQTYHPPFYYLVNSLLRPMGPEHIQKVRYMSALYGIIVLFVLYDLLRLTSLSALLRSLVVLFITTTPAYISIFTHYNNDSMGNMFCFLLCFFTVKYLLNPVQSRWLFPLFICGVLGVYSKMTVNLTLAILTLIVLLLAFLKKIPWSSFTRYILVQMFVGLSFLPWAIGHNYRLTGQMAPQNCEVLGDDNALTRPPIKVFFQLPGFQDNELSTPFCQPWFDSPSSRSYLKYLFSTSLFSELEGSPGNTWVTWGIFWLHILAAVISIQACLISGTTQLSFLVIILASLFSFPFLLRCPYRPSMNFRYIAWTWLPWGILLATALREKLKQKKTFSFISVVAFLVLAICCHFKYLLIAR